MDMINIYEAEFICQSLNNYFKRMNVLCQFEVFTLVPLQFTVVFNEAECKKITPEKKRMMCREIRSYLHSISKVVTGEITFNVYMTKAPFEPHTIYCLLIA